VKAHNGRPGSRIIAVVGVLTVLAEAKLLFSHPNRPVRRAYCLVRARVSFFLR